MRQFTAQYRDRAGWHELGTFTGSRGRVLNDILDANPDVSEADIELTETATTATQCQATATDCRDNLSHPMPKQPRQSPRRKDLKLF